MELVARTLADHAELARLAARLDAPDAASLLAFADGLTAHVRFEERQLFPAVERLGASSTPNPRRPDGQKALDDFGGVGGKGGQSPRKLVMAKSFQASG